MDTSSGGDRAGRQPGAERTWLRWGISGAILVLAGVLLSGPIAALLVTWVCPQPEWSGPALWAVHYHRVQTVPYFCGLLLIAGFIQQAIALHGLAEERDRPRTLGALLLTGVFATLIAFNYMVQITFLPSLAWPYEPAMAPIVATFSFSNPASLCWTIEMWGYGFLGVATWLFAAPLRHGALERVAAALYVANGVISLVGVALTIADPGWVFSLAGGITYGLWNLIVLAAASVLLAALARRLRHPSGCAQFPSP